MTSRSAGRATPAPTGWPSTGTRRARWRAPPSASLLDWSAGPEHDPVPYFWSDLLGRTLQYVGAHAADDAVDVDRGEDGSLVRARWTRGGTLTAWLGVDARAEVVKARTSVGRPVDELV